MNNDVYLTTEELSARIKYDCRTIRDRLKDSVLIEGIHYFRPFGGRKILYVWAAIERDMKEPSSTQEIETAGIPLANGSFCNTGPEGRAPIPSDEKISAPGIPMASGGYCNV